MQKRRYYNNICDNNGIKTDSKQKYLQVEQKQRSQGFISQFVSSKIVSAIKKSMFEKSQ
jgi:hypothetical protein